MKRILIAVFILLSVPIIFITFSARATVVIEDVSPQDGAKHVDITDNPPDPGGYVTLSATLNNSTNLEYWLDVWNGTAWINRQHATNLSAPVYVEQAEESFNQTNTTYTWRIRTYDHVDNTWNNQTFTFTTDKYPSPPECIYPENNSLVEAGEIVLKVKVNHPDNPYGAKIYNVTFHEYPSGRLIGWNATSTGWDNGTIVTCNQTFLAMYPGIDYYWYAVAYDDEYNVTSPIYKFITYYNDTTATVYYPLSSQITVETTNLSEPSTVYYFLGSNITVAYTLLISNPSPPDGATDVYWSPSKGYVTTSVQLNKSGQVLHYRIRFYTNKSGTWEQYKEIYTDVPPNGTVSANLYNLKYNTTYWWKVEAYNESDQQTKIFSFTTMEKPPYNETEPSSVYYLLSSQITVETIENEPSTVYYFLGSNITVAYTILISNPSPPDGATDVYWSPSKGYVTTSVQLNKSGQVLHYRIRFYTNKSGTWEQYKEIYTDVPPNGTVSANLYNLKYNTTYWWKVEAYNESDQQTKIFSFTTMEKPPYNETEPSSVYYLLSSQITVETIENEPSTVYYLLGSNISVGQPSVSDPYPPDNSVFGRHYLTNFSVYVEDPENQNLTVSFYYANNNTCWATVINVKSGTRAVTTKLPALINGTKLEWYVTVNDSHGWNITSPTWSYTPKNNPPTAIIRPEDGDSFVEVRRKIEGWYPYVRLEAKVNDVEHDRLKIQIYVDDPSQPNWNDWILRLSRIDEFSIYNSTKYIHDELEFDELDTTYHWWLHLEDEYGATADYYANFTTKFFFYAYFTYYPEHPTQEDVVHFIDKSENATDIAWYINGERVAYKNFTSGKHEPFNLTYRFNVSGIYNVTLWIHNDTADATDFYYEIIYVDWNLTLNRTKGGAGINYATIPFNVSIFNLSKVLLKNSEWIHYYDSINETWLSAMKFNNSILGDNITLDRWSSIAIVVGEDRKVRINISDFITIPEPTNFTQRKTIHKGYWYLGWSGDKGIDSYNLSKIGLEEGDWVFAYDTINGTWYSYKINFAGDKFIIKPHHVIIALVGGDRDIIIPS